LNFSRKALKCFAPSYDKELGVTENYCCNYTR
jgi:hypothetical protein